MQLGDDLANTTARVASDISVEAIKASKDLIAGTVNLTTNAAGNVSKAFLELLLKKLTENNKFLKPGKTNLMKLIKSEKGLKMTDIKESDAKLFAAKAKRFGLTFAIIKDKQTKHVIYRDDDIENASKIFELVNNEKLKQKEIAAEKSNEKKIVKKWNENKLFQGVKKYIDKVRKKPAVEKFERTNIDNVISESKDVHKINNPKISDYKKVIDKEMNRRQLTTKNSNKIVKESIQSKITRISRTNTKTIAAVSKIKVKERGR